MRGGVGGGGENKGKHVGKQGETRGGVRFGGGTEQTWKMIGLSFSSVAAFTVVTSGLGATIHSRRWGGIGGRGMV